MRRSNRERRVRLDPLYDLAKFPAIFLPDSEAKDYTTQPQSLLTKPKPNKNLPNTTKFLKTLKGDYMDTNASETGELKFRSSSLKGKTLPEAARPVRASKGYSSRLGGMSDLSRRYEENSKKCKDLVSRKTW